MASRLKVMSNEIKIQVINKLIHENGGYMQNLQLVVGRKLVLYRKKGLTQTESLNKVLNNFLKKKYTS
jgi:hypothetical protein